MTQPVGTPLPSLANHRGRLLRRSTPGTGVIHAIGPEDAGWSYVGFDAHRLVEGDRVAIRADDRERLILVLEGRASLAVDRRDLGVVGSRDSVFEREPAGVALVAPGSGVDIVAVRDALVVVGSAPGADASRTFVAEPGAIFVEERGTGQTARRIHHLLPPSAEAGRLIAFEVYTPGGNWSSYPPHKHDTEDPPREAYLEEVYFYRFARPTGFALQRVYTPDRELDETLAPGDGDVVLVPAGYHVVGAPAGYDTYYLNVMAGPNRAWHFTVDPDHAWLMDWDPSAPRGR